MVRGMRDTRSVQFFIFMQFLPENRLVPPFGLAPPLGNPGSATGNLIPGHKMLDLKVGQGFNIESD